MRLGMRLQTDAHGLVSLLTPDSREQGTTTTATIVDQGQKPWNQPVEEGGSVREEKAGVMGLQRE